MASQLCVVINASGFLKQWSACWTWHVCVPLVFCHGPPTPTHSVSVNDLGSSVQLKESLVIATPPNTMARPTSCMGGATSPPRTDVTVCILMLLCVSGYVCGVVSQIFIENGRP